MHLTMRSIYKCKRLFILDDLSFDVPRNDLLKNTVLWSVTFDMAASHENDLDSPQSAMMKHPVLARHTDHDTC